MKKLEQIRQESKEIEDKIDDTEERLRQIKNQEKNSNAQLARQFIIGLAKNYL